MAGFKTKVTPEIEKLTDICRDNTSLDLSLYAKYDVKRGLRDINGKGIIIVLDFKRFNRIFSICFNIYFAVFKRFL